MNWLFKEEPSNYSFDAFVKDGETVWSGVKNPLAQKHLRAVKKGDRIFFYHTGDEKAVVGVAKVAGEAKPDSTAPSPCLLTAVEVGSVPGSDKSPLHAASTNAAATTGKNNPRRTSQGKRKPVIKPPKSLRCMHRLRRA